VYTYICVYNVHNINSSFRSRKHTNSPLISRVIYYYNIYVFSRTYRSRSYIPTWNPTSWAIIYKSKILQRLNLRRYRCTSRDVYNAIIICHNILLWMKKYFRRIYYYYYNNNTSVRRIWIFGIYVYKNPQKRVKRWPFIIPIPTAVFGWWIYSIFFFFIIYTRRFNYGDF